jgi:hypothetical protein
MNIRQVTFTKAPNSKDKNNITKKVAGIERHDTNYSNRNQIQQGITSSEGTFLLKSQNFQLYA